MTAQQEKLDVTKSVNILFILGFIVLFFEYTIFHKLFINADNEVLQTAFNYVHSHFSYQLKYSLIIHVFFVILLFSTAFLRKASHKDSEKTRFRLRIIAIFTNLIFIMGYLQIPLYDQYVYPGIIIINLFITNRAFAFGKNLKDESFFKGVNKKKSDFNFWLDTEQGRMWIPQPQRNSWIDGGPGAGKSASIIKPFIMQAIEQNAAGFIYDFEGDPMKQGNPILTKFAYNVLKNEKQLHRFAFINFTDLARTNRVNILKYLNHKIEVMQLCIALMKNLNPEWKEKIDFWGTNAITYIASIMMRLFNSKEYRDQGFFTLPHVIALALSDVDMVIPWLEQDAAVAADAQLIITPWKKGAEGQTAGATSSAMSAMAKLNIENIFYVLTEDKNNKYNIVDLDISSKNNSKILCIGNSSRLSDAISPVLSCISYVVMNNMNQPGKERSIFLVDELPTMNLYGLDKFIAEVRKHGVSTVLALQDFNQAERDYGQKSANILRTSCANQFFGNTGNLDTAKSVCDNLGDIKKSQTSFTEQHSGSGSQTESFQKEKVLQPRDITAQPPGHFLCKIADGKPAYSFVQLNEFKYEEKFDIEPFNLPTSYTARQYQNGMKDRIDKTLAYEAKMIHDKIFNDVKRLLEIASLKFEHNRNNSDQNNVL